jgi:hypothetical protein
MSSSCKCCNYGINTRTNMYDPVLLNHGDEEMYLSLFIANFFINICCLMILWSLVFSTCKNVSLSCIISIFFLVLICLTLPSMSSISSMSSMSSYNTCNCK